MFSLENSFTSVFQPYLVTFINSIKDIWRWNACFSFFNLQTVHLLLSYILLINVWDRLYLVLYLITATYLGDSCTFLPHWCEAQPCGLYYYDQWNVRETEDSTCDLCCSLFSLCHREEEVSSSLDLRVKGDFWSINLSIYLFIYLLR